MMMMMMMMMMMIIIIIIITITTRKVKSPHSRGHLPLWQHSAGYYI